VVELIRERVCAEREGGVVVFLIGMRINRLSRPWTWMPVMRAMPRMLAELAAHPELGMLSARSYFGGRDFLVVQYWKSAEHLQAYARAAGQAHLPAWQAFNARIGTGGDVGIWHETYVVPEGHSEAMYVNMPRYGLGLVGELFAATGHRATAAKRLARMAPAGP
jgi:hypothetical protein